MKSASPRHIWMANRDRMFKGLEQRQAQALKPATRPVVPLPDDVVTYLERMNGHLASTVHDNEATRQMRQWARELLVAHGHME